MQSPSRFYQDTYLGYLNATGVQLNPGLNSYRYTGLVKPAKKGTTICGAGVKVVVLCSCTRCFLDLGVTSEFLSNYLTGKASSVVVRGLDAGNRFVLD